MTLKTIKPINKETTNPKSKVLQEANKSNTESNNNDFDFKKRDLSQVQSTRRKPLKNNEQPPSVGQSTDKAIVKPLMGVLEHCMKVRENLLKCHSIEIISSYSEIPNK